MLLALIFIFPFDLEAMFSDSNYSSILQLSALLIRAVPLDEWFICNSGQSIDPVNSNIKAYYLTIGWVIPSSP